MKKAWKRLISKKKETCVHVTDKCTSQMNTVRLHLVVLVGFRIPSALLVPASSYGFDSRVGSRNALDLLSHVLRGDEWK